MTVYGYGRTPFTVHVSFKFELQPAESHGTGAVLLQRCMHIGEPCVFMSKILRLHRQLKLKQRAGESFSSPTAH